MSTDTRADFPRPQRTTGAAPAVGLAPMTTRFLDRPRRPREQRSHPRPRVRRAGGRPGGPECEGRGGRSPGFRSRRRVSLGMRASPCVSHLASQTCVNLPRGSPVAKRRGGRGFGARGDGGLPEPHLPEARTAAQSPRPGRQCWVIHSGHTLALSLRSPQTLASSPVSHPLPAGTHLHTNARLQTATRPPSGLSSPPLPTGALTTRLPPAPSPHREGSPDPSPLHPRRRPPPLAMGTPREATHLVTGTPREAAPPGDGDPEGDCHPW